MTTHDDRPTLVTQVHVDATRRTPLRRIWTYAGYDEPNYTYGPDGRELLAKLGRMGDAPYYIRCHFMLCNGESPAPKWGFTNVYTEDELGRPVYSWEIIDRILDTIVASGCVPFVELGFMPRALTTAPEGTVYEGARADGWKYPPRDYGRWLELIRALARHCLERYGLREVSRWYWELWNEPDLSFYWRGTVDEYCRLYDYTEAGVRSAIPQAKVGGPGTTSPGNPHAGGYLRAFLDHCLHGTNAVTGAQGTRLDYVSFHTKGGGYGNEPGAPKKTPSLHTLLAHVAAGLEIMAEFHELRAHEVILSECDPDGWAAGTTQDNPNLAYRNSEYYGSYVGASACKLIDLANARGPRVDGMLTWAFAFENRDYFAGLRTLSTNGVDKPVLNVLRLLAELRGARLALRSDAARDPLAQEGADAPEVPPDVSGIATLDAREVLRILLVSHHDDWDVVPSTEATVRVSGLVPGRRYGVSRIAVDRETANAHTAWQRIGAPQPPDAAQRDALIAASLLRSEVMGALVANEAGEVAFTATLGSHGAYLFVLEPEGEGA